MLKYRDRTGDTCIFQLIAQVVISHARLQWMSQLAYLKLSYDVTSSYLSWINFLGKNVGKIDYFATAGRLRFNKLAYKKL